MLKCLCLLPENGLSPTPPPESRSPARSAFPEAKPLRIFRNALSSTGKA